MSENTILFGCFYIKQIINTPYKIDVPFVLIILASLILRNKITAFGYDTLEFNT